MKLNNTSKFSDELVREVINFAKPSGVTGFSINVRDTSRMFHGRAWYDSKHISVSVAQEDHKQTRYPYFRKQSDNGAEVMIKGKLHKFSKVKGYLEYLVLNDVEALVQVTAHEMFHLKQYVDPKCHRVWGSRGKQSERACDAFGIRKMREWRRTHPIEVNLSDYMDLFDSTVWGDGKDYQCVDCKQMFQRDQLAIIRTGGFNKKPINFSGLCETCFIPRFKIKGSFYTDIRKDNWTSSTMTKVGQKYWSEIDRIDRKLYPHNFVEEKEIESS